jgi:hypothetical protein
MKILCPLALSLCAFPLFSQTTLILQPGPEGKDAKIFNIGASANYGDDAEFIASTLYYENNEPGTQRSMIQFDLSSIPTTAGIIEASLSLYHNNTSPSAGHVGNNASYLRRIIEPWNESTVNFLNAPAYSTVNQVTIPASSSPDQDYEFIDVSQLVRDMIVNPSQSHGFMFMGVNEAVESSMKFYSGDATQASLRPRLIVTWTTNAVDCITLQPGNDGKDAKVFSQQAESNFGGDPDLVAEAWNFAGNDEVLRSYIEFDLDALPNNITITDASLSLYYNDDAPEGHAGDNVALLQRITEPWTENTVSWGDQPATTDDNQVILPVSQSSDQDYENVNVTALIQDMIDNPSSSHGLMLRLQNEEVFRRVVFASSDHPDDTKHPKLEVCYTFGTATNDFTVRPLIAHPNPFTNEIVLEGLSGNFEITISDVNGKLIFAQKADAVIDQVRLQDIGTLNAGIYVISANNGKEVYMTKMAKAE